MKIKNHVFQSTSTPTYLMAMECDSHGSGGDLGFSDKDRVENIRRISEAAAFMIRGLSC